MFGANVPLGLNYHRCQSESGRKSANSIYIFWKSFNVFCLQFELKLTAAEGMFYLQEKTADNATKIPSFCLYATHMTFCSLTEHITLHIFKKKYLI